MRYPLGRQPVRHGLELPGHGAPATSLLLHPLALCILPCVLSPEARGDNIRLAAMSGPDSCAGSGLQGKSATFPCRSRPSYTRRHFHGFEVSPSDMTTLGKIAWLHGRPSFLRRELEDNAVTELAALERGAEEVAFAVQDYAVGAGSVGAVERMQYTVFPLAALLWR